MTLCSDDHDEVCFEGRNCPACQAISEKSDAEKERDNAKDELADLNKTIDNLEEQIKNLQERPV